MEKQFNSFAEFYPFYLGEHDNPICRGLHYTGSLLAIVLVIVAFATSKYWLLWFFPLIGYGFAWTGHFFFEKNTPATFKYPLYSFMGDWVMLKDFLTGRLKAKSVN